MGLVADEQACTIGALREIDLREDIVGELVADRGRDVRWVGDVGDAGRTHDANAIIQELLQLTPVECDERTVHGGQLVEQVEELAYGVVGHRV